MLGVERLKENLFFNELVVARKRQAGIIGRLAKDSFSVALISTNKLVVNDVIIIIIIIIIIINFYDQCTHSPIVRCACQVQKE